MSPWFEIEHCRKHTVGLDSTVDYDGANLKVKLSAMDAIRKDMPDKL